MSEFFNKYFNIKHIMQEKRKYRQQVERVKALPEDYQFVFNKIQHHMWSYAAGDGYDIMEVQYGLIELFEESAAEGKSVLEITGDDVAGFTEELLKDVKTYTTDWRRKMNEEIKKKLKNKQKK